MCYRVRIGYNIHQKIYGRYPAVCQVKEQEFMEVSSCPPAEKLEVVLALEQKDNGLEV